MRACVRAVRAYRPRCENVREYVCMYACVCLFACLHVHVGVFRSSSLFLFSAQLRRDPTWGLSVAAVQQLFTRGWVQYCTGRPPGCLVPSTLQQCHHLPAATYHQRCPTRQVCLQRNMEGAFLVGSILLQDIFFGSSFVTLLLSFFLSR